MGIPKVIDQSEIDEMKRLLAIMDGKISVPVETETKLDPNVAAMKRILETLNAVQTSELTEAINTQKTERGARIGSWEIISNDGVPKTYDVINVMTQEPIAKDLYVYECGAKLCSMLNQGIGINDPAVKDILLLEEEYVKNRNTAAYHKNTYKNAEAKGDLLKAAIAEDRYNEAREKAMDAHDRILYLAGLKSL